MGKELALGTSGSCSHIRIRGPGVRFAPFGLDFGISAGRGDNLERLALVNLWDGYFLIVKIPGRRGPPDIRQRRTFIIGPVFDVPGYAMMERDKELGVDRRLLSLFLCD